MTLPARRPEHYTPGYASAAYARSLAHMGSPRALPHSGGWILERPLPDGGGSDAAGPYPLFTCPCWEQLEADLEALAGRLVSLVLVIDPFCPLGEPALRRLFPHRLVRYKTHYLVHPARLDADRLPRHHRRNLRRAGREVEIDIQPAGLALLDEWAALYALLVARHGIRGPARFPRAAFARQLQLPGMFAVRARAGGRTVGMQLWLQAGRVGYYHLGASDQEGYRRRAAYAMTHEAIRFLGARDVEVLDLGGGAGVRPKEDGLTRFKQGWATDARPVFLGGRILDPPRYRELCAMRPALDLDFFPLYRAGVQA